LWEIRPLPVAGQTQILAIQGHFCELQPEHLNHYFNFLAGISPGKMPLRQARKLAHIALAAALFF